MRLPGGFRRRARPWPCACDAARATCALHRPRGSPEVAALPPAGSVILKNGNELIRPVRGFPRGTGWVMAPASGAGGIGSQVGPAAVDGSGLRAFAAPSTCMGPPLTESPGRCQVHERVRRAAEPIRASTTTRRAAHEWRPVLERMARRCARHRVPARLGHGLQRASGAPGAVAGGLQQSALRRGTNVRDLVGHGQPGSGPGLKGQVTTATPLRSSGAGHEGGPREPVVDARGAGVVNGRGADARRNRPDSRALAWASDTGARRLHLRNTGRARAAPGVDDCAIGLWW